MKLLQRAFLQVWTDQIEQQELWHDWGKLALEEKERLIKELLLGSHEELAELQRYADQSRYHLLRRNQSLDLRTLAEHGVDVFKYLVALLALCDVKSSHFAEALIDKTRIVRDKWEWETAELSGVEVLACDLDGCVADWGAGFSEWCSENGVQAEVGKLDRRDLEPMKDAFHEGGGFAGLNTVYGAAAVLNDWKRQKDGRRVIFITARPYKRFRRIYADTIGWLERTGIEYQHVLFEREKADAIRSLAPARVVAFIEDRGKHALEVAATGTPVLKLPYDGADEQIEHEFITNVQNWHDIHEELKALDRGDR